LFALCWPCLLFLASSASRLPEQIFEQVNSQERWRWRCNAWQLINLASVCVWLLWRLRHAQKIPNGTGMGMAHMGYIHVLGGGRPILPSMALLTPMRNTLPLYAHFRTSAANKKWVTGPQAERTSPKALIQFSDTLRYLVYVYFP